MRRSSFIMRIIILLIMFSFAQEARYAEARDVRPPAAAGEFYPSDKADLTRKVDGFLSKAAGGEAIGQAPFIIAPHAGYVFSGYVAARAFKQIQGKKFESVIIIGPSHHVPFEGVSVYDEGAFRTPLGEVPVDSALAEEIIAEDRRIFFYREAHMPEHSIEVELPFLQRALGRFKFVPILMGSTDRRTSAMLADAVSKHIAGRNILVVVSTDMSHYPKYEDAEMVDRETLDIIKRLDAGALYAHDTKRRGQVSGLATTLCGLGPVATAVMMANKLGYSNVKVLEYANSGDTPIYGDKKRVVGYGAVVIYKAASAQKAEGEDGRRLSKDLQERLIEIARQSVEGYIRSGKRPNFKEGAPALNERRGAFVTLTKHGRLRGCIGTFRPREALFRVVSDMAIQSATADFRFVPVAQEELGELEYEISVLTPLKRIYDINEIEVGRHGIYIIKGFNSGVLLPQVATKYGWDRITFLEETCRKAGLPRDAYKKGAEIYIFSAEVFGE